MSTPSGGQPFWRTKRNRRGVDITGTVPLASSSLATGASGSPVNSEHLAVVDTSQSPGELADIQPTPALQEQFLQHLDNEGLHDLPQEDGFLGLFIRVCCWQADHAARRKRESQQLSPYAGRISYQRARTVKIGEGTSFNVLRRYDRGSTVGRDSRMVVMKDPKIKFGRDGRADNPEAVGALLSEIEIMSHKPLLSHLNIVQLLDIRWDHPSLSYANLGPTLYIEYAELGTLPDFYASENPKAADSLIGQGILLDICYGLQALHQCGITHGDVKPSNVLIFLAGETLIAKVSDFGCSMTSKEIGGTRSLRGISPPWDSPEAGKEIPEELLHKTDIYSFGLLYWWFRLEGNDPFNLDSDDNVFGFTGNRTTRLDRVKLLKQSEDLGTWVYRTISASKSFATKSDMDHEISVVSNSTLITDPTHRNLEAVVIALKRSIPALISRSPRISFSPIMKRHWTPHLAWTLPLELNPNENIPAHRFVQTLKVLASEKMGTKHQQVAVKILLFRSHFEGFGIPRNLKTACTYLKDVACETNILEGSALLKTFYGAAGVTLPQDIVLDQLLASAMRSKAQCLTAQHIIAADNRVFEDLVSVENKEYQTETQILHELEAVGNRKSWDPRHGNREAILKRSLVHHAAAQGWVQLLQKLINNQDSFGCNQLINEHDSCGYTPLLYSCKFGHANAALFLLENGASAAATSQGQHTVITALHYLPNLRRDSNGRHIMLQEMIKGLVAAGANIHRPVTGDFQLQKLFEDGTSSWNWDSLPQEPFETPLGYALWVGDLPVVEALLDAGAIPQKAYFHFCASMHRTALLDALLSPKNCPFSSIGECTLNRQSLLETALTDSSFFSPIKRLMGSKMVQPKSTEHTITYLLARYNPFWSTPSSSITPSYIYHCCRSNMIDIQLLEQMIGPIARGTHHGEYKLKCLTTAIMWNNPIIAQYLLSIGESRSWRNELGWDPLHTCTSYTGDVDLCAMLLEHEKNVDSKQKDKSITELETPFQIAVTCQNFQAANFLFEQHAARDEVILSSTNSSEDLTLLGWLIRIIWSESQNRIRYLFDEYPKEPTPKFIVAPKIGRSALQQAACCTPASKWDEQDAQDMMEYLVQKYPGSRHLEYQRIDDASLVRGDTQHSGVIHAIVDGKSTVVKNAFHFNENVKRYDSTIEKEHNGTALHFAVRAVNYKSVQVLLEAGADASAMIGLPLPDKINLTRKPGSTYAVKENDWASTVLDFAILVNERMEQNIFPSSMPDKSIATIKYFRQRSLDVIDLLIQNGAANSVTFVGKRGEKRIYQERRQKGNIAAFRMFKKELKGGLSEAWKIGKTTYRELVEEYKKVDPRTPGTSNNHGAILYQQGRLNEALEIFQQNLSDTETHDPFGIENLRSAANVALVMSDQGRLEEAEKMYQRALTGYEATLGSEHASTLNAMHNLAALYTDQERFSEAEILYQKTLEGREKVLGLGHESTIGTTINIAKVYWNLNKNNDAENTYQKALKASEKHLGPAHAHTMLALHNFGIFYSTEGMLNKAEPLLHRAFAEREKILGREHLDTLGAAYSLAHLLEKQGKMKEAESMYLYAFTNFRDTLGIKHPTTLKSGFRLGYVYMKLDELPKSDEILSIVLKSEEDTLGPDHSSTLVTLVTLAEVVRKLGRYKDADQMYQDLLRKRLKTLDPDSKTILDNYYNLGLVSKQMKAYENAAVYYRKAAEGYQRTLGEHDTETLEAMEQIANVLSSARDSDPMRSNSTQEASTSVPLSPPPSVSITSPLLIAQASPAIQQNMAQSSAAHISPNPSLTPFSPTSLRKNDPRPKINIKELTRMLKKDNSASVGLRVSDNTATPLLTRETDPASTENPSSKQIEPQVIELMAPSPINVGIRDSGSSTDSSHQQQDTLQKDLASKTSTRSTTLVHWNAESVESAISAKASLEALDSNGFTPLLWAIQNNRQDLVLRLLDKGADVLVIDKGGRTAMHLVAWNGNVDLAGILLEKGAVINLNDMLGSTVLHYAATKGQAAMLQLLIPRYSNPGNELQDTAFIDAKNKRGLTALHLAAFEGRADIVDLLLSNGAHVGSVDDTNGFTPLLIAVDCRHVETLQKLIMCGANVEDVSNDGGGALHNAAWKGRGDVVSVLLENGANANARHLSNDWTALFFALHKGHEDIAQLLIDHGADVNLKDVDEQSPLHIVVAEGVEPSVRFLLENDADIESENCNKATPLHLASAKDRTDILQLLLECAANVGAKTRHEKTPLHLAAEMGLEPIVRCLLDFEADVGATDCDGCTPLHWAAIKGHEAVARALLRKGADAMARDNNSKTALQLAAEYKRAEVMAVLVLEGSVSI